MHDEEQFKRRRWETTESKPEVIPHRVHEGRATMIPVRGDVRLVDGNETLVFSGSQKAISWLNKIFTSMHESSLPARLQKHSRRSSSAPSRTLTSSPREFTAETTPFAAVEDSPPIKTRRPKSREKSPRHGVGMRRPKAWGSQPTSPSIRDQATSLTRQKKSFLRGKRPSTSSPRDSTISSRAKSCERVRPKSSGILSPSSPQKRRMVSSLNITPAATVPSAAAAAANGNAAAPNAANDKDLPPATPHRFSITPQRARSQERPSTAAANKSRESPSSAGARERAKVSTTRGRRRTRPTDDEDSESPTPTPTPRQLRNERPINERVKTLSISPFSQLARMTISSANRRRTPTATALMRRFGTASKLTSIPELLLHRPGSPVRPSSPQNVEQKRPWDYTDSPTSSTPREHEKSNVTSPLTPRDHASPARSPAAAGTPRAPKTPLASAAVRPVTPIASGFLRPGAPDEESWRRVLSNPHKTFFKNPLFNKALERKPSTALRSLAHPGGGEMIMESTLKQFSSATRKFISRALTRISKVDSHPKPTLATVIVQ